VFGEYDQYAIHYRLATLPPAAKLQQMFDARQWQALQQHFAQARGLRQHLIDQGYFSPEDLDGAPPEASP
jgi:hypothetical protein